MLLNEVFAPIHTEISFSNLFENADMGREYKHLEDLIIFQGSQGGLLALSELKSICRNPQNMNMKWDGMAAIFWGRDSDGRFVLAPLAQWSKGLKLNREQLANEIKNTGKARAGQSDTEFKTTRQQMSDRYRRLWDLLERATPANFRGYLNGDLMFDQQQTPAADGIYNFTPNKVTYRVSSNGLFGKMPSAQAFITVHGKIDQFGQKATTGLTPISDAEVLSFNKLKELIVLPTQHPKTGITGLDKHIDDAMNFIRSNATAIDAIANYTTAGFTKLKDMLYRYSNKLSRMNDDIDFDTWLLSSNFTESQKQHADNLKKSKPQEWDIFWKAFNAIRQIKNTVWQSLEKLEANTLKSQNGIQAEVGGKPGGEGFVKRMANGRMGKLINPAFRSAADNPRYAKKITESANSRGVVWTFGRMNPPHWGHGAVINTMRAEAKKRGYDWILFVSSKQEPKKNPLSHSDKINWLKKLFPHVDGHVVEDPDIKTLLQAATWLYKNGYRQAVFVAGKDNIASYGKVIRDGNDHGRRNPELLSQGRAFLFNPLEFIESERLATATTARSAASDGDSSAFAKAILGPHAEKTDQQLVSDIAHELYNSVRHGMALSSK